MPRIGDLVRQWQERRAPVMTARTNATNIAPIETIEQLYGNYTTEPGPAQLTLDRVEDFRNILLEQKKLSKVTVARYLSVLRAACGEHLAHLNIGKLISELNREPNKVECWTREEAIQIIRATRPDHCLSYYIDFLFATGMRRGELLALHWEDFDLNRKRIHIHQSLTLDGSVQNGTKWGCERWFPMGERHLDLYESARRNNALSDYGTNGMVFYMLDQRQVGRRFNRVRDAAGVRPFKMHCTRHSAISWALSSGMSLRKASEIFGVSQATLEKHYAHFVDEEVNMDWANL